MRGVKPKPTHLKEVTGNPGKRPLHDAEPNPVGDLFAPPEHLTPAQKAIWTTVIANAPAGMLKRLDCSILVTWVVAYDYHQQASAQIAKFGLLLKAKDEAGQPYQNPFLAIVNRQAQIMIRAGEQLGFSPSSRSRVRVTPYDPDTAENNPYAEFG